jgi:autotransporter passenger strand-loop-strand repeat protein
MTVLSSGTQSSMTVSAGQSYVVTSSGAIEYFVVSGDVYVYSGGTAYNTTDYNVFSVQGGGSAYDTTISSGGYEYVYASGNAGAVESGATVDASGELEVGSGGAAYNVTINNAGEETVGDTGGSLSATDSGATVNAGGSMLVYSGGADYDSTINAGGTITVSAATVYNENVEGTLTVISGGVDSGSTVNSGGYVFVESNGNGYNETVNLSGQIDVQSGGNDYDATLNTAGASIYISSGGYNYNATNDGGAIVISSGGVDSAAAVYSGEIVVYSGGSDYDSYIGGLLYNSGGATYGETVASGGTMNVSSGGTDSGSTVYQNGLLNVYAGGTITDDTISGGFLYLGSGAVVSGGINFVGENGVLQLAPGEQTLTVVISGFGPDNYIDLQNLAYDGAVSLMVSGDAVTVTSGGITYDLDVAGASTLDLGLATDHAGGTVIEELCHLRGTRILTPNGMVNVEDLQIGDLVMTRFNAIQPVRWIGRQCYDSRFIRDEPSRLPVRIHAGALGPGLPARDLYVSPGHSLLIGDRLVLARALVNGLTITQNDSPAVIDYFNIELAAHDCLIAEGVWSESFADGPGLRDQFHNAAEFYALYPDAPPPEQLTLCAPRPECGPELGAALRPVVARAAAGVAPGPLAGFIDEVDLPWRISGWAHDTAYPDLPVLLEILLDDAVIGTVLACDFRQDVRDAGFGRGRCAFTFTAPHRLRPEHVAGLRVRRVSDGASLRMTAACEEALRPARTPLAA